MPAPVFLPTPLRPLPVARVQPRVGPAPTRSIAQAADPSLAEVRRLDSTALLMRRSQVYAWA
jgi:hypothetical protein